MKEKLLKELYIFIYYQSLVVDKLLVVVELVELVVELVLADVEVLPVDVELVWLGVEVLLSVVIIEVSDSFSRQFPYSSGVILNSFRKSVMNLYFSDSLSSGI